VDPSILLQVTAFTTSLACLEGSKSSYIAADVGCSTFVACYEAYQRVDSYVQHFTSFTVVEQMESFHFVVEMGIEVQHQCKSTEVLPSST
jgi:hypothetical protein